MPLGASWRWGNGTMTELPTVAEFATRMIAPFAVSVGVGWFVGNAFDGEGDLRVGIKMGGWLGVLAVAMNLLVVVYIGTTGGGYPVWETPMGQLVFSYILIGTSTFLLAGSVLTVRKTRRETEPVI